MNESTSWQNFSPKVELPAPGNYNFLHCHIGQFRTSQVLVAGFNRPSVNLMTTQVLELAGLLRFGETSFQAVDSFIELRPVLGELTA
jgi:hypothetical protein